MRTELGERRQLPGFSIDAVPPCFPLPCRPAQYDGLNFLGAGAMGGALDGIRVLELARYQAGPRGGMLLSDLGAEVIKIEKLGGEETRKSEPLVRGQSVYFTVYNRGKKSLCLDMRTERGKEIFAALVPTADIVLQNFRPGVMEKMGFGRSEEH